ncbi:MAG: hypothetical protein WCP89_00475, partial [archaeon]
MSYKRIVKKGAKTYGPYIYKSYRDRDGKVKKIYIGKAIEDHTKKNILMPLFAFIAVVLLLAGIVSVTTISNNANFIENIKESLFRSGGVVTGFFSGVFSGEISGNVVSEDVVSETVPEPVQETVQEPVQEPAQETIVDAPVPEITLNESVVEEIVNVNETIIPIVNETLSNGTINETTVIPVVNETILEIINNETVILANITSGEF